MRKLLLILLFTSVCFAEEITSPDNSNDIKQIQIDSVNLGGKHIKPKEITTEKITVTGNGSVTGNLSVTGNGSVTGNLSVTGEIDSCWQRVYYSVLTSKTDSVSITGLNGDNDIEYKFVCRLVNGLFGTSTVLFRVRFNNDAGANYNYKAIGVAAVTGDSHFAVSQPGSSASQVGVFDMHIWASQGLNRQVLWSTWESLNTINFYGGVWLNSNTNLTSISITTSSPDGIGVGSVIELWARR
jgi:hypothetical protein